MEQKQKPSLHYVFAYRAIPSLVLGEHYPKFLELVHRGPKVMGEIFQKQWKSMAENGTDWQNADLIVPKEYPAGEPFVFSFIQSEEGGHPSIFCVNMPAVRMVPEATALAIALGEKPRYFTCELSFNSYVVGEVANNTGAGTDMGGGFAHLNYGEVKSIGEFIDRVKNILRGK
jgi:hypothetical protein